MFKKLLIVGVVVGGVGLLIALAVFNVISPETAALAWDKLPGYHKKKVLEIAQLRDDEQPLIFYSAGFLSFRADGNLVTTKAVYSWSENDGGEFQFERVPHDKITSIQARYSDDWTVDSQILVWHGEGEEEDVVALIASNEKLGDRQMVSLIEKYSGKKADEDDLVVEVPEAPAHPAAKAGANSP